MINKKKLENLLDKFLVKKADFCIQEIEEQEDESICITIRSKTCNCLNMYNDFLLEKEDLKDVATCLEATATKIYDIYQNFDVDEEFQVAYESGYMRDNPSVLIDILNDYDERLKEATDTVCKKIYNYLNKLQEKQEQENKDDQR